MRVRSCSCLVGVEFLPGPESLQSRNGFAPRLDAFTVAVDLGVVLCGLCPFGFEFVDLCPQGGDLALVGPPEHPAPRVVDAVAIVLVVALAGTDLSFARDGLAG